MRVLLTGGFGCIGSWVAMQLAEAGEEVWIYDLKEDAHRLDLILEKDQRSSIHFVPGDVSDVEGMRTAVDQIGATHILHLAGLQSPTCRSNPLLGAKVNVIGTLAVFEAALTFKDQVRRVVYASSAAVHSPTERSRSATSSTPASTGSSTGSPASASARGPFTGSVETSA